MVVIMSNKFSSVEDLVGSVENSIDKADLKRNFKLELYGKSDQRLRGVKLTDEQQNELLKLHSLKNVIGFERPKQLIIERFIESYQYRDDLKNADLDLPTGMLLSGYPGVGKSMFVNACINDIFSNKKKFNLRILHADSLMGKDVGRTTLEVRNYWEEMKKDSRNTGREQILVVDEADVILLNRKTTSVLSKERVRAILSEYDGVEKDKNVSIYLIGTTNRPWDIDPAFMRHGRFSENQFIAIPPIETRIEMVEHYFRAVNIKDKHIILPKIAELTNKYTGADISHLAGKCFILGKKHPVSLEDIDDIFTYGGFESLSVRMQKIREFKEHMKGLGFESSD